MKKLLSVVLAVALIASLSCFNVSAAADPTPVDGTMDFSLMPANASDFKTVSGGDGTATVTKEGDSFVITADKGWPYAYPTSANTQSDLWASVNLTDEDVYLNWDFEVVSGATKVAVYICGQNPEDMAAIGNYLTINGIVNPDWYDPMQGDTAQDLGVGVYKGSVKLADFYEGANPLTDMHINREMVVDDVTFFSGFKVFAVGNNAKVVVNDISIGKKKHEGTAAAVKSVNLLTNGSTNGANGESEVTFADGAYTVNVTEPWGGADNDVAYGMQVTSNLTGFDLTGMYLHVGVKADVPFRVTTLDQSDAGAKWINLCAEFFNVIGPVGQDPINAAQEGNFFPAGEYEICVPYHGIYDWQTNQGTAGWDTTNANLTGIYFEAKEAGTFTVDTLKLSAEPTFSKTAGTNSGESAGNDDVTDTPSDDNTGDDNTGDATTTKKTTTTAKKTTTTTKRGTTDDKADNVETGDVSSAALFAVVAVIALAVVALSAKKARD